MHPSHAIRGSRSSLLHGKRVIVGVSGSIAAVEVVKIIRELIRHGAKVTAVTTPGASRIVTPEALEFATGERPITELTGRVEHVEHFGEGPERADLYLLAPATANTLSKIAHGIDDTPVTTFASMALGNGVPVVAAPAMHAAMARNPFVAANLKTLAKAGVDVMPPLEEEGEAKLPTPEAITARVLHALASGPWRGKEVLIIGGSTSEPIDEVRSVTNGGSGRLAVDLAVNAYYRGANVTLWMGEHRVTIPSFLRPTYFRTISDLDQMLGSQRRLLARQSAVIVPAALSDFTVEGKPTGKIESAGRERLSLTLRRTQKMLPRIRGLVKPPRQVIGFKLQAGVPLPTLLEKAEALRQEASLDAVVANDVASMGAETTTVHLVTAGKAPQKYSGSKSVVAGQLLDALGEGLP